MADKELDRAIIGEYKLGFEIDIEQETVPPGLSEEVIRYISKKKDEPSWMLELRLKAYRKWHRDE